MPRKNVRVSVGISLLLIHALRLVVLLYSDKQGVQGLRLFKDNMSVNFRSVLISDPVDESCGALLAEHGIPVTTKYKLPKDELINELQVGEFNTVKLHEVASNLLNFIEPKRIAMGVHLTKL